MNDPAWKVPLIVLGLLVLVILGGTAIALIWEANVEAWNPVVGWGFMALVEILR